MTLLQRIRNRLAAEHGVALVLALGVLVAMSATATTAVAFSTRNEQTTRLSKSDQIALVLAEAGLNNALAVLHAAPNPTQASAVPPGSAELEGGTASWSGALAEGVWTLTGVGSAHNPVGTGPVVRTVSTRVRLGSSVHGSNNNAVWNYVYADQLTGCTTVGNSSEVNVPLYIRGSLCLQNQAKVTSYALQVGGDLSISNQATVGTAEEPIHEAHIGGTCSLNGGAGACGPGTRVFAGTVDHSPTALTKPPVDFANWYANAQPGPQHPCTVGSIPGGFDNDGVWNRSRAAFNLTPATAYDCRVYDSNGELVGQLSWTPGAPGRLVVKGTIFFDGDVTMGQSSVAVYEGRATLYAAGRFTMAQQSSLCGVADCTDAWDPMTNLLAVVAGQPTGDSVTIANYSSFQGAIYAVNDYREGNNSTVWGPIIANQIFLQNSTMNHYVPIGTLLPGMPATYEEAVTLTNEPGSWG